MNILQKLNPTYLTQNAIDTIKRFPFVVLFAALTGVLLEISKKSSLTNHNPILVSCIGISAFLALNLYFERSKRKNLLWPAYGLTLGLLGLLYFFNPNEIMASNFRLLQILAAAHVLVALAPFLAQKQTNGFWYYNQGMFIRFFISSLYTGVLLIGMMVILMTLKYLFHLSFENYVYRYVGIICIFFFHPIHFLNGVPQNFEELENKIDYPKAVQVFSKYLLVPLVCIYGIILITYCITLLSAREWPKGIISSMIIGYSIVGIYTQLMIYPLINSENSWAERFSRLFNLSISALSFVILAAAYRRITEYGVTESRYFLVLTGLWLLGISLYLMIGKKKDIRIVPMSLFLAILLTAFGPWGAYSVSLRLQMARLEKILVQNKVLLNGKINKAHPQASWTDQDDVTEIVKYVIKRHGAKSIRALFEEDAFPKSQIVSIAGYMNAMGLVPTGKDSENVQSFYLKGTMDITTDGYAHFNFVNSYGWGKEDPSKWVTSLSDTKLVIRYKGKIIFEELHDSVIKKIGVTHKNYETHVPPRIVLDYGEGKAKIHFFELNGQLAKKGGVGKIGSFQGVILY